jgi:riboflavin synthase
MDVQFNGDEGYPTVPTTAYKYFFNWKLIKLGCETERMKKDIKVIPSPKFQLKDTARVCSQPVYQVCGPNPPTGRTYRYLWSPSSNDTNQCKGAIASGWYNLTVTNEFGCVEKDSTEITVDPSPVFNLGPDTSFCRLRLHTINTGLDSTKNIVTWNNSMAGVRIAVQSPGVYIATAYNTANFCMSKDTMNLSLKDTTSSILTITACDSFYWAAKNKTYTSNNTDTANLINAVGCDSIVRLNLTIKNSTSSTFTTSACDSYYWPAKNKTYTTSNNTDTVKLINAAGCDSIVTLNLTIKNSTSSTFTTSACDSYYWPAKNKTYTTSNNTDTVKLINAAGCDSIVTLNLTIKNSNSSTFTTSACDSYYWTTKNKTYTTNNNTDTVKLINAAGCDSIVTLNLTIKNATSSTFTTSACDSYYWPAKNKTYTISNNTDTVKLINVAGCDSIVTLNLTIKNATSSTFTTSACDSYYWPAKNKTYTISNNTDTVKLINTAGCDSIVTLNLTIKNSNSSTFTISACGSYYWPAKNKSYTTSNNTDTVKLINAAGCDSIVTLNLTIKNALSSSSTFTISACGSYYWAIKNKTYTISNNSDTVKLINAAGCDSIVTLSLTIYPNPIPTIIKTGNVLSTQYYNSYQWLLNGVNIIGATTQSYTVVVSGNYQVVVTDTNNCSGASSIGAVILSSLNEAGKDYFKIYPNPSEKMLHIETNASGNWQAIITDVKGSQINQIHFNKSTQLDISNYSPGVYYIQLTGKENVLNYKFMKK